MGCTLGIRIIHLHEDLLPQAATDTRSKNGDRIPIKIGHEEDVVKSTTPDIASKTIDVRTAESPLKARASVGYPMSGDSPPEVHQEDNEMLPSIFSAQDKKPPRFKSTLGVNFPSITFPCSPRKSRSMPLNATGLAGAERESIRMRALRGLIQKQMSDVTDGRRSHLPPICPSKLRKSSSCNDSWLQEIMESDEVLPELRLPAITEVDPTGTESKLLSSTKDSLAVSNSRSVSMRSLQTRSSWLTSCTNAKRAAVSIRDRSPMASLENPRLPVILEDLDSGSPLRNSPKKFSSKSLDNNAPDTLESRSLLQVPKIAIPAENSVWLAAQLRESEIPSPNEMTNYGTTHGYSKTMAEVLGLSDSSFVMDYDILDNMTVDPSSPLLVNFVSKDTNRNAVDETRLEIQNRSNERTSGAEEDIEDKTNGNMMSTTTYQDPAVEDLVQ